MIWSPLCIRTTHLIEFVYCSPKQWSASRLVAPLGQIITISSQPVFALISCVLSREAENPNVILHGLTLPR